MESKNVAHEGILTSFRTLKDGTVAFTVNCQELSQDIAGRLFMMNNQYVKFLITSENITDEMADALKDLEIENPRKKKTPAQRLRGAIYVYWEQKRSNMDFEEFYPMMIQRMIDMITQKLD
jgi:hypothetical protein